jgi:excisionase family DNA binding protein
MNGALRPTLTVEQAAKLLGISRGLAYQGVREGSIPSIRIGRRILIPTARLQALLGADLDAPAAESANGRLREGQLPVGLVAMPGREPSSEEER